MSVRFFVKDQPIFLRNQPGSLSVISFTVSAVKALDGTPDSASTVLVFVDPGASQLSGLSEGAEHFKGEERGDQRTGTAREPYQEPGWLVQRVDREKRVSS